MTEKISTSNIPVKQQAKKEAAPRETAEKKPAGVVVTAKTGKQTVAVAKQAKKVEKPRKIEKTDKPALKAKVVRDKFSMPGGDYAKIGELKQLCLKGGVKVKKSQLLRAGLHALEKLSAAQLKLALANIDKLKG